MSVKPAERFLPLSGMTHRGCLGNVSAYRMCCRSTHAHSYSTILAVVWWQLKRLTASGDKTGIPRSAWVSRDVPSRIWTLSLDVFAFGNAVFDMLNLCSDPNVIFSSLCRSPLMFYSESSPSACSLSASFLHTSLKWVSAVNASHVTAINKRIPTMKCIQRCLLDIFGSLSLSRQCDSFYFHWFSDSIHILLTGFNLDFYLILIYLGIFHVHCQKSYFKGKSQDAELNLL